MVLPGLIPAIDSVEWARFRLLSRSYAPDLRAENRSRSCVRAHRSTLTLTVQRTTTVPVFLKRPMTDRQRPAITIRTEALPPATTVLLHMGNRDDRAVRVKVENVLRAHDYWFGVLDGRGRFAVSAYALVNVDEATILDLVPHGRYGRSTIGRVSSAGFELLPTSISILGATRDLQDHHYSVLLAIPGLNSSVRAAAEPMREGLRRPVADELQRLLDLFDFVTSPGARTD